MKRLFLQLVPWTFMALIHVSCIRNDIPYPHIVAAFEEFKVYGEAEASVIDENTLTVSVVVDEEADLERIAVEEVRLGRGVYFKDGDFPEQLDLSRPYPVTLSLYQDYRWVIMASQPVERYVHCSGQVGEASFDVKDRIVTVYVSDVQSLSRIEISDMKLERIGAVVTETTGLGVVDAATGQIGTVTQECEFPMVLDCSAPRIFEVNLHGEVYSWIMDVKLVKVKAAIENIAVWCRSAEVSAVYDGGPALPSIEWRRSGVWTALSDAEMSVSGVALSATITGLAPGTHYQVRLVDGEKVLDEVTFRTCQPVQLYNMDFGDWWQSGKIWYPYSKGAVPSVWDTANPGTAALIGSSTVPTSDAVKGLAVKMESRNALIAFAAGNLFTGRFGKVSGLGAVLDWGTEYSSRPVALTGWFKYFPLPISKVRTPYENMKGKPDKCQIQVLLTDWDYPFTVDTSAGVFVDYENDPGIIASARFETDETVSEYENFTLPIEYRDSSRMPKFIVITCTSSYLGDSFTGGEGSTLYVDEFQLLYDQP